MIFIIRDKLFLFLNCFY